MAPALLDEPIAPEVRKAARVARVISREMERRLVALVRRRDLSPNQFMDHARRIIDAFTPQRDRTVQDALLSAYLRAAQSVAPHVPQAPPPPDEPPPPVAAGRDDDPEPLVRFPMIEAAARSLQLRNLVTRPAFDALANDARRAAFTISRVSNYRALESVRDALAEDVAEGGTLRDFKNRIRNAIAKSPLSPQHQENIYRTNLAAAYSAGQRGVLQSPLVRSTFRYGRWVAVHDRRVRPDHLAMERAGIGGGPIYRLDDPHILRCWPPASYNCRCHVILMTVRDAARYGVREAQQWLATGQEPSHPQWVDSVPIELPRGWVAHGPEILAV